MHRNQLNVDEELAGSLVAAQFPAWSRFEIEKVSSAATVNSIFRIGSGYVARFPLHSTKAEELEMEAERCIEFSRVAPFPVPSPIAIGKPSDQYDSAWSIYEWIPGEVAKPEGHPDAGPLARDIVSLISVLRSADVKGQVFDGQGRGGDLGEHDKWVSECCEKSGHIVHSDRVWSLWQKFCGLPKQSSDVMSHKDLTPFNLLIKSNRLIGVLDCGNFGPADPALDLVIAWHLFEFDDREIIRRELNITGIEWRRGAAWALQQAMGLVWYYEETNPEMSQMGTSTIRRILEAEG
ncbi:MAG: phosphotransferase [Actinobacteria bacterium]|nr:phosphotransferase [Actinomycetota bacterium]